MNNEIGYEVDFLPVGNGERSGDAIALRYGNLHGKRAEQVVITIDGGTVESGEALVQHIIDHYHTDRVDIAFLSHPDNDHASGMRSLIEELNVEQIAMHLPWKHSAAVQELLDDGRLSCSGLSQRAKEELCSAREVAELAAEKQIPIVEPFAGISSNNGRLVVLGPTPEYYQSLLANFRFMPGVEVDESNFSLGKLLEAAKSAVLDWIPESWLVETLVEPAQDATTPENNSSAIFLLTVGPKKLLFTGDAGVPALVNAAHFAIQNGISLQNLAFAQVPHHGSRHNVGKAILNHFFGNIRPGDTPDWTAFISASAKGAPKHPHKKVTNALRRRGARVVVTEGISKRHHFNAPARPGWVAAGVVPFFNMVENDE